MHNQPARTLKRDLGIWGAAAIVVGTVIGSGIFLVPKTMVMRVGSPEMVMAVWVFGGFLTLFGALTYAELAAAMPEAGGEYVYLREAYGPFFGFLYGWTQTWVAKSASIATIATGFSYYLGTFFPVLDQVVGTIPLPIGPGWSELTVRNSQLASMVLIMGLAILNYFGVKLGGHVQIVVTAVKVGAILAIVIIGLTAEQGSFGNYATSTPAGGGLAGFLAALVAALWAYDGWNNLNMVAAEVRDPRRNLPLALIAGTLLVMAIYIATNLAYFFVLPASAVASSDRVAATAMQAVMGPAGAAAVSVAAMISMFAAVNGSILSGSRIPYALARDGYFFSPYSVVNERYRTPGAAILLLSAWAAVLVLSGRYDELYTMVIFPSWILYAMAAASAVVLRRKRPDMPRPYKTLGYPAVPVLFVGVAVVLIISTLLDAPRESAIGLLVIAAGVPFYLHWKRRKAL